MAKRLHDTDIWKQDWFLEMPTEQKIAWIYIKDNCDHAGIWKPEKKMLEMILRGQVDLKLTLELVNKEKERVVVLKNGRWFLKGFLEFQYGGHFNENNRVHASIKGVLESNGLDLTSSWGQLDLNKTPIRPQVGVKEGVKDKDKDKDSSLNLKRGSGGDEIHQTLTESPNLKGITYDQDLVARKNWPGLDYLAEAKAAVAKALLLSNLTHPASWWNKQLSDAHMRKNGGFRKDGGYDRDAFGAKLNTAHNMELDQERTRKNLAEALR